MKTRRLLQSLSAIATLLLLTAVSAGSANAQIFVDGDGGSDVACNGTSANVATIPNCPFRTVTKGLADALATAGTQTIQIAAANYAEASYDFNSPVIVEARSVALNTVVQLGGAGDVNITSTVEFRTLAVGGAQFFPLNDLNLTGGSMNVTGVGVWNNPGGNIVTRMNGFLFGDPVTWLPGGNSLMFTGTTCTISIQCPTVGDQVVGNELNPAGLGGGTLTIIGAGIATLTFPNSISTGAGATLIAPGQSASVTVSSGITTFSLTVSDANTHIFSTVSVTGGDFLQDTAASSITVGGDIDLNTFRLDSMTGTFVQSTGSTNFLDAFGGGTSYDGATGVLGTSWIEHSSAGSMTLNNISGAGSDGDGASDIFTNTIHNHVGAGSFTIAGTVTEATFSDAPGTDTVIFEIIQDSAAGAYTVSLANTFSGFVDNDGSLVFSAGGILNGDVDNDNGGTGATITIGGGTLTLTFSGAAFTALEVFLGGGTLALTGSADVPASTPPLGISTVGGLTLAGSNDGLGGATLAVGGTLLISGTANWTAGGIIVVAGDMTVTGSMGVLGGTSLVAAVTITGDLLIAAGTTGDVATTLTVGGNVTINSGSDLLGPTVITGDLNLNGANNIGDGDVGDDFSVGGDLNVGVLAVVIVAQDTGTTNDIGKVLNVSGVFTFTDNSGAGTVWTVDEVFILEITGGGGGIITLGNDNFLIVQGDFTGGAFDGTDDDGNGIFATLFFSLPDNNAVFSPGPNTKLCDFSAFGNELTLVVTVSFEVQCNANILDDSTVDFTDILMRITGVGLTAADPSPTVTLSIDAKITSDPTKGSVAFESPDTDGDGCAANISPEAPSTGQMGSFFVNTPGAIPVCLTGSVIIDGIMSLVNGGLELATFTATFDPDNDDSGIIINTGGTGVGVGVVITGGTVAGLWDMTFTGDNTVMLGFPGREFHPGPFVPGVPGSAGMDDVIIKTTGVDTDLDDTFYGVEAVSIAGNLVIETKADLVDPMTVAGALIIPGILDGGLGALTMTGVGAAHSVTGTVSPASTFAVDNTLVGGNTGNLFATTLSPAAVMDISGLNHFTGLLTVGAGADLTLGFNTCSTIGCGTSSVPGGNRTMAGIAIAPAGMLTFATPSGGDTSTSNAAGGVSVGAGSLFDMNGRTFNLFAGSAFTADISSDLGSTGTLVTAGGGSSVNTLIGGGLDPADINNFRNSDAGGFIPGAGGFEVTTWADIDALFSGPGFFNVSTRLDLGATVGAPTMILGTVVNAQQVGTNTFSSSLTINSPATGVQFVEAAVAVTQTSVNILGLYTQTMGDVDYTNVHLIVDGGFSYFAGDYTAGDANDEFIFRGSPSFTTNSGEVAFRTVRVTGGPMTMGTLASANDAMQVEDLLFLNSGLNVGSGGITCYPADLTVGDGAGTEEIAALGGNVNLFCGGNPIVFSAPDMLKITYGSIGTTYPSSFAPGATAPPAFTNDELPLPGVVYNEVETNLGPAVALDRISSTNNLDLNGGGFLGGVGATINIADGGTVFMGVSPATALDTPLTFDTPVGGWTLDMEVGGFTISLNEWPLAAVPGLFTTTHPALITSMSLPLRTAHDVTVGAGSFVDLLCVGINVTGDLTSPGNVISTCAVPTPPGTLTFMGPGPVAQNTFGPVTLPQVAVANPAGLILNGGNLSVTNIGGLPLAAGVPAANLALVAGPVITGPNLVILEHVSTAVQGFSRVAGAVVGTVSIQIVGGVAPLPADVLRYPVGAIEGIAKNAPGDLIYRPGEITLNDPSQVSILPASGLFIMMTHGNSNPLGANNMPLDSFRNKESTDAPEDPVILPLRIARYSPFFWQVTTSANLSPSVSYDVQFDGGVYPDFDDENVERMRMIRRQDGDVDNFWILVSDVLNDNDNFAVSPTQPIGVVRNAEGALIGVPGTRFTMGLESNMTTANPGPLAMNMGQSAAVDLTTVFGGGTPLLAGPPPTYTYSVSAAKNAPAVSASIAGDGLTINGIAEGVGTVTVTAVDALNDNRSVDIIVQVNPVFMANDIDDAELNVGGSNATYVVDLAAVFDGGTPPVGFAITNDNGGSATAVRAGTTLTVTALSAGTVNIGVTGTDATGATATSSFTVTVNAAMAGSPIAAVDLKEDDAAHEVDLSAVFSGGDGSYTYAVSTDDTHITASESGGTLSSSVVTAFAAGTTIGTVDVTVTATDGIGDSAVATLTVDVFPRTGNVLGAGPSPADAAITLDYFLGLAPGLTAKQVGAADMNGDAAVNPFDAALNFSAFFGKAEILAVVGSYLEFGEVAQDGSFVEIPLQVVGGELGDVVSASFEAQINPEAIAITAVESSLGDDWLVKHSVDDEGILRIGIAGYGDIASDGTLATIKLQLLDRGAEFILSATGAVNDNEVSGIDEVEIVELPETFALQGNYPNPFNPSTTIQFDLPETADVEIQLFDMLGRRAMVIPAQSIEAGVNRSIQLNAAALASGSYFYRVIARMDSKTLVESGRMMLVK